MVGQSSGGLFERDYDYTPTATGIRQLPIQVWSQKSLEARWLGSLDRSKMPTFLYLWQPEPTMEKMVGR